MEAMKASNDIFKIFIGKPSRALRHTSPRVNSAQGNHKLEAAVNDAEARLSRIEARIAFRMREGQPV